MANSQGIFINKGVFFKFFILFSITVFLTLLVTPVIAIVANQNPTSVGIIKITQLIMSIVILIIPPFVLAYLCSDNTLQFLHLNKKINLMDVFFVFLFMLIVIPFVNLLSDLNHQLVLPKAMVGLETWMKNSEENATQLTVKLLNVHNIQGLIFNVFLISMIPAFGEELFFRGAIQGVMQQKLNIKVAIWITAIIFSTIHLQFYGFLPRMLLGAFFGYLLFWSENIWLPIAAHFTNNFIAILFYYFKNNGYKLPDIDSVGTGNTLWLGLASGSLAVFGFFWLKKRFQTGIVNL
ncbi:MAG: type II CAAX endopeptidase family protein [Paludibacter sp.]|nr:type II CAAX endopeptidase family protein [Paludibacter sp.]